MDTLWIFFLVLYVFAENVQIVKIRIVWNFLCILLASDSMKFENALVSIFKDLKCLKLRLENSCMILFSDFTRNFMAL